MEAIFLTDELFIGWYPCCEGGSIYYFIPLKRRIHQSLLKPRPHIVIKTWNVIYKVSSACFGGLYPMTHYCESQKLPQSLNKTHTQSHIYAFCLLSETQSKHSTSTKSVLRVIVIIRLPKRGMTSIIMKLVIASKPFVNDCILYCEMNFGRLKYIIVIWSI